MAASVETISTTADVEPDVCDMVEQQGEEQGNPPAQSQDCLQQDGLALCDHTSKQCFTVERRIIARRVYSLPAVARSHLLLEVIGNSSGLLECQWKIADVVAESVNALEQRLLRIADSTESEDGSDSTGKCLPSQHACIHSEPVFMYVSAPGESLGDLIKCVRRATQLLDVQGLLCICPAAVIGLMNRPWRFHLNEPPTLQATVRNVPSMKAVTKMSQNDAQYCLELWARFH
jgi:hypothetical protein